MKIEDYSFGKIKIQGKVYDFDVLVFPEKVKTNWWRKEGHFLTLEDIQEALTYSPDTLIIGTGAYGEMKVDSLLSQKIAEQGIKLIVDQTLNACKKYNELRKNEKVVGAFHLTC
jgi:hypothetical protein